MPGSRHSAACAGLWKRVVASNTARALTTGSTALNSPPRHAVSDDLPKLRQQGLDVCLHHLTGIVGKLKVIGKQFGVIQRALAFGHDQGVQPAAQALWRGAVVGDYQLQRLDDALQPTLGDGIAQRGFGREMAVDAAVAHAQRPRHVHHRRLVRTVAAEHILRRRQNLLRSQYRIGHAVAVRPRSLSRCAMPDAL